MSKGLSVIISIGIAGALGTYIYKSVKEIEFRERMLDRISNRVRQIETAKTSAERAAV